MGSVLAVLDHRPSVSHVLSRAQAVADLIGAPLETVYVHEPNDGEASVVALERPSATPSSRHALSRMLASSDVSMVVVAGVPVDGLPATRAARYALQHTAVPFVVLPPMSRPYDARPLRRLLVPLDGDQRSSAPVRALLTECQARGVRIVGMHVFTPATAPTMIDRPYYDVPAWCEQFLDTLLPGIHQSFHWATGTPGNRIAAACTTGVADLAVLAWSRQLGPGHADVVRTVLARAEIPVALIPVIGAPDIDVDVIDLSAAERHRKDEQLPA